MDPFTQRMIEKAKERKAKYAGKLQNDCGESRTKTSPLQESNQTIFEVTTKVTLKKSPMKASPMKEMNSPKPKFNKQSEVRSPKQKIFKENRDAENRDVDGDDKTNSKEVSQSPPIEQRSCLRDTSKSKLKRLGALYSNSQLSSPIHRTESRFCADSSSDSDSENVNNPQSTVDRLGRFAQLADRINGWEDEPRVKTVRTTEPKEEEVKKRPAPQPPTKKRQAPQAPPMPSTSTQVISPQKQSPIKLQNELKKESPIKEMPNKGIIPAAQGVANKKNLWDKRILETLESQGFQRTVSNSKLIFDYNKKEQQKQHISDPPKILEIRAKMKPELSSPERKVPFKSNPPAQTSSSVMQRAALFESTSPTKKNTRDPSELPLHERLALFEKGGKGKNSPAPLIPKAAFAMNIPISKQPAATTPSHTNNDREMKKLSSPSKPKPSAPPLSEDEILAPVMNKNRQFPIKPIPPQMPVSSNIQDKWIHAQSKSNTECIVESQRQERQLELQALKDRWNGQRHLTGCSPERLAPPLPPPQPPQLPQALQAQSTIEPERQPVIKAMVKKENAKREPRRSISSSSVKRIKVSPPKPGMLYPNLSDIDATTTDTDQEPRESPADISYESSNEDSSLEDSSQDLGETSFGREILNAATNGREMLVEQPTCNESSDDSQPENMLRDFDGYLDTALDQVESDNDSEPTPPKRGRTSESKSSLTAQSNSFEFKPQNEELPEVVEESSGNVLPLMHTVSFYRRQQHQQQTNSNVRQIIRTPTSTTNEIKEEPETIDPELVKARISKLLDEVSKQQAIISQTSQALNFCESTFEFTGSKEQLEAERLLLLSTHRRQAMLNEVQRLRVEGSTGGPLGGDGNGELQLSTISVTLNRDFLRQMANDDLCQYLVCLARCGDQVKATSALEASVSTLGKEARLQFPGPPLKLTNLPTGFIVALEVYCYKFRKEILPEEIKYHITQRECQKSRLTPKKHKADSRLTRPPMHSTSAGGSNAVRVPCFQLSGHVMFSLRETHRTHFTLTKVTAPYASPLEGSLQIQMSCTLALNVTHAGFLTVFQEVGGFGAWHRRWARLDGDKLLFWKYPDDEKIKKAMQNISLSDPSSTPIGPVSRDKCARPNTFLVETTAISQLLSADTREEREEWCRQLNKALGLVRAWGGAT